MKNLFFLYITNKIKNKPSLDILYVRYTGYGPYIFYFLLCALTSQGIISSAPSSPSLSRARAPGSGGGDSAAAAAPALAASSDHLTDGLTGTRTIVLVLSHLFLFLCDAGHLKPYICAKINK
jgi:hypothetical protein